MHTITAKAKYTDQEIKKLEGYFIQDHHYDQIIDYDCDGYKEDGSPLFFFRKNVIPASICEQAYKNLRTATAKGGNRGSAGGVPPDRKNTNTMNLKYNDKGELVPEKTPNPQVSFPAAVILTATVSSAVEISSFAAGLVTLMPRFPALESRIFSAAVSDKPVANTKSVSFTDAENVASASA